MSRLRSCLRLAADRPTLLGLLAIHSILAILVWLSGSPLGTYGLECSLGAISWDIAHGLNPAIPLLDYFDTFTGAYLTQGLLAAPLTWLPGRTIYALKAANLLTLLMIAVLAWTFLERNVGRVAAALGAAALLAGPPILQHHSLFGPGYHYNELLFDFGFAVLWAEIALHGRRSWPWYAAFGLVSGYAIFNCFGSAAFLAVTLLLWWVTDRGLWRRAAAWAFAPGFLVGLGPLLWKATGHARYHQPASELRDFLFTHTGDDGGSNLVAKALAMPLDYGGALGFIDTLGGPGSYRGALAYGTAFGLLTLATVPAMLLLDWRGVRAGLRGLLPLERCAPDEGERRALARLLPSGFALALIGAYLTSELQIHEPVPEFSQFRVDRFLPPLSAMLALNLGVLAQRAWDRPAGRLRRVALGLGGVLAAAVLLPPMVARATFMDRDGFGDGGGIPYRSRCYAIEALYAADVTRGDPERGARLCAGFPEDGHGDCYRGFAWGVGIDAVMSAPVDLLAGKELQASVGRSCLALGEPWQRPCWRQLGWHLISEAVARHADPATRVEFAASQCRGMPDEAATGRCLEGLGFYYADHYAFEPRKLGSILPVAVLGQAGQRHAAAGIGALFAHQYERRPTIERLCAAYDGEGPGFAAACIEGADSVLGLMERPLPMAAAPGPLPP